MDNLTLDGLAERINKHHAACERALKDGLRHAVEAGKLLIEAKKQCEHGKWLPWIKESCEFSARTAQGYMRVFNKLLDAGNAQRVAHLSYRQTMVELSESGVSDTAGAVLEVDADVAELESLLQEFLQAFKDDRCWLMDKLDEQIGVVRDRIFTYCNDVAPRAEDRPISCTDDLQEIHHVSRMANRCANLFAEYRLRGDVEAGKKVTQLQELLGAELPTHKGKIDFGLIALAARERITELEAVEA